MGYHTEKHEELTALPSHWSLVCQMEQPNDGKYDPVTATFRLCVCRHPAPKHATNLETCIGGELYESVGVEAPILLSYTHKN